MATSWAAQKRVAHVVREAIIRACRFTCAYCGGCAEALNDNRDWIGPDGQPWHIDHVRPADRNDPSTLQPENLVLACSTCNTLKGARTPAELRAYLVGLAAHVEQMKAHRDNWPS